VANGRKILAFATKGAGSNEEARIAELLADHDVELFPFDREHKAGNVLAILRRARRLRPALLVMEHTGIAGGIALLLARGLLGIRFVVSTGDAVGPYLAAVHPALAIPAAIYERVLYRASDGYIGWTPYLVGRAIALGAPRAMTAAGFTLHAELPLTRDEVRDELGIPRDVLLFGIVGSLPWNPHKGYCYGLELVQAVKRARRDDVAVVVVGAGTGLARLRELAGDDLGRRVFLPGPVPHRLVASYLAAMDVGSLPQTLDQVGALRYTTKITEYVTARLPFVTGRLPMSYDLADTWSWRLPGRTPWDETYVAALAGFMESVTTHDIAAKQKAIPPALEIFQSSEQRRRVAAFVGEILEDVAAPTTVTPAAPNSR
jgi:hypothetical protein